VGSLRHRLNISAGSISVYLNGRTTAAGVIGHVSIHDEVAALEYAQKAEQLAAMLVTVCLIVIALLGETRTTVAGKDCYTILAQRQGDLHKAWLRSRQCC